MTNYSPARHHFFGAEGDKGFFADAEDADVTAADLLSLLSADPATDYSTVLGKVTDETPWGNPGLYAPDSDEVTDAGWVDFSWVNRNRWTWGYGAGEYYISLRTTDDGSVFNVAADGIDGMGFVQLLADATESTMTVRQATGQTVSPFVVKDSAGTALFEVDQNGALKKLNGQAQPTGVAVTAGGIHAALVTLGLIAA